MNERRQTMAKRILDCYASDFDSFNKSELLESIRKAEGRTILAETIGVFQPLLMDVTNAELAASMGADLILLNMFDVWDPIVNGLPDMGPSFDKKDTIRLIKKLQIRIIHHRDQQKQDRDIHFVTPAPDKNIKGCQHQRQHKSRHIVDLNHSLSFSVMLVPISHLHISNIIEFFK